MGHADEDYGPKPNAPWQYANKGDLGLAGTQALYNISWPVVDATGAQTQNFGWSQLVEAQTEAWFNGYVAPAPESGGNFERTLQTLTDAFYAGNAPKQVETNTFWVPPADAQQFASYQTNITNYVEQWTDEFITGAAPLQQVELVHERAQWRGPPAIHPNVREGANCTDSHRGRRPQLQRGEGQSGHDARQPGVGSGHDQKGDKGSAAE